MRSRRHFVQLSVAALLASAARAIYTQAEPPDAAPPQTSAPTPPGITDAAAPPAAARQVLLPLALASQAPTSAPAALVAGAVSQAGQQIHVPLIRAGGAPPQQPGAPLLGPASGSAAQAIAWLSARSVYADYDVNRIVSTYQRIGDSVGLDWFLAIAQMAHETGSLTSWWSQAPRRNPAGIGVTGEWRPGLPDGSQGPPPGPAWAWSSPLGRWLAGVSFATWASDAIPAHLGRLLAYALPSGQGDPAQRALVDQALGYRSLPASHRGVAPTILGLNGRWAVPGTEYGQRIMLLAEAMRRG
jgi:hypothetical protein